MRTVAVAAAVFVGGFATTARAQAPIPGQRPLILKSTAGADLFKFYCSSCHGVDAKGRAATSAGKKAAPDLTALARRNGGMFPRERVHATITHGSGWSPSHGAEGMPVWGAIFRGLDPNDNLADIRIENLVQYLESIQGTALGAP